MSPVRARQCCDEEASGKTSPNIGVASGIAKGERYGPIEATTLYGDGDDRVYLTQSYVALKSEEVDSRAGCQMHRDGDHLGHDGRNQLNLKEMWRAVR